MSSWPAVRFDRVSKTFDTFRVLDDVSFDVQQGETFCILGRSGAGKSVTLRQMIGLVRPDSGHVYIQGENVAQLDPSALARVRRKVGYLFQYSALFDSISVAANVAFPLERHTRMSRRDIAAKVRTLLDQVGLAAYLDKMPAEISGGMRKRVGLARAMALEPEILLADEPGSGLDPITALEIDRLLLDLKQRYGTTIVVVTHDIPSARRIGDTLAFLHDGKILDRGTPAMMERSRHALVQQFMSVQGGI